MSAYLLIRCFGLLDFLDTTGIAVATTSVVKSVPDISIGVERVWVDIFVHLSLVFVFVNDSIAGC